MATRLEGAPQTEQAEGGRLQDLAKRHLWMHFTRMGAYEDHELPIIVRGEGSYVWDEKGNRYLDGLSALFCVNAGHGRAELGEAAARQSRELGFYTNWSYAHPPVIELATLISDEVICSWGRLGHYLGCERYDYQPDLITTAKGLTSAYAPMGAVIASDKLAEPFLAGTNSFAHGFTFGGHPVASAVALAN